MAKRVSTEDLEIAASWLEMYNDGEDFNEAGDAPEARQMFAVAAWMRDEVARRKTEAQVRQIAKEAGVSTARARAALMSVREGKA